MVIKNTKLGGTDFTTPSDRVKPTDLNDTFDAAFDAAFDASRNIIEGLNAAENLAERDAVRKAPDTLTSFGWVKARQKTNSRLAGPTTPSYTAASQNYYTHGSVKINDTLYAIAYAQLTSNNIAVEIFSWNGTTLTRTAAATYSNCQANLGLAISKVADLKIMVAGHTSNDIEVVGITLNSDGTIASASQNTAPLANTGYSSTPAGASDLAAIYIQDNKVLLSYTNTTGEYTCRVLTFSGNICSGGSETVLQTPAETYFGLPSMIELSPYKFIIQFSGQVLRKLVVVEVDSGTYAITAGTPVSNGINKEGSALLRLDNSTFIAWYNASTLASSLARLYTVSGNTITFANIYYTDLPAGGNIDSGTALVNGNTIGSFFAIGAYNAVTAVSYIETKIDSYKKAPNENLLGGTGYNLTAIKLPQENTFMTIDSLGAVNVYRYVNDPSVFQGFVGIAATAGNAVSVHTYYSKKDGFTSLKPGEFYKISSTTAGGIELSASDSDTRIGMALTTTKILTLRPQ